MKAVFADTYYWLALINPRDQAHQEALVLSQTISEPLITSTWVLTEVADAMIRESKDAVLRKNLAVVLPSVSDYGQLEALEKFARAAENADIRQILERRVRAIRLLQDYD